VLVGEDNLPEAMRRGGRVALAIGVAAFSSAVSNWGVQQRVDLLGIDRQHGLFG